MPPTPREAQIRFAIRNNYCRCTGYVKIVAAIRLAGQILREGKIPSPSTTDWRIGSRVHRLDVEEKVLGYGKYPDDYYLDGMCYGSAVRSKIPARAAARHRPVGGAQAARRDRRLYRRRHSRRDQGRPPEARPIHP